MPGGSLAKAASFGAKTVYGPLALERANEARGLDGRDQRLERTRGNCRIDDVCGPREGRAEQG